MKAKFKRVLPLCLVVIFFVLALVAQQIPLSEAVEQVAPKVTFTANQDGTFTLEGIDTNMVYSLDEKNWNPITEQNVQQGITIQEKTNLFIKYVGENTPIQILPLRNTYAVTFDWAAATTKSIEVKAIEDTYIDWGDGVVEKIQATSNKQTIQHTYSADPLPDFYNVKIADDTLTYLGLDNKGISLLNVSYATKLEELNCSDNVINSLNLSKNIMLRNLYCNNNALIALDLSNNISLERVSCVQTAPITVNLLAEQFKGEEGNEDKYIHYVKNSVDEEDMATGNVVYIYDDVINTTINWSELIVQVAPTFSTPTKGEDEKGVYYSIPSISLDMEYNMDSATYPGDWTKIDSLEDLQKIRINEIYYIRYEAVPDQKLASLATEVKVNVLTMDYNADGSVKIINMNTATMKYSTDNKTWKDDDDLQNIQSNGTYYIKLKDDEKSPIVRFDVQIRQAVPTDVKLSWNSDGTAYIYGVTENMEVSEDKSSWKPYLDVKNDLASIATEKTYYIRTVASDGKLESESITIVAKPDYSLLDVELDTNADEKSYKIKGWQEGLSYKINYGGTYKSWEENELEKIEESARYYIKSELGNTKILDLIIPTITYENGQATIEGLNSDMEFNTTSADLPKEGWEQCSNEPITGITASITYYVRFIGEEGNSENPVGPVVPIVIEIEKEVVEGNAIEFTWNPTTDITEGVSQLTKGIIITATQETTIDWGDNTELTKVEVGTKLYTHEYQEAGERVVKIKDDVVTKLDLRRCIQNGELCESLPDSSANNQITQVNIKNSKKLASFNCSNNNIKELDVSGNTELTFLSCCANQLSSLDVSANTKLTDLRCFDNQITALDVSKNTELTYLSCGENQLSSLDVSANTKLETLNCDDNQITALDVSKNTELTFLSCGINKLSSLDVSTNTKLKELWCYKNQLTALDVSRNINLLKLYCFDNNLTELNISKNPNINSVCCVQESMNKLYLTAAQKEALDIKYDCVGSSGIAEKEIHVKEGTEEIIVETYTITYNANGGINAPVAQVSPAGEVILSGIGKLIYEGYTFLGWSTSADGEKEYDGGATYALNGNVELYAVWAANPVVETNAIEFRWKPTIEVTEGVSQLVKGIEITATEETTIDWGDNTELTKVEVGEHFYTHEYQNAGEYVVKIKDDVVTGLDLIRRIDSGEWSTSGSPSNNQIYMLDLRNSIALRSLYCAYNQLTELDVSKNTALKYLYCSDNQLTELDVSKNTGLTLLVCNNNQLTDVSKNIGLTVLYCSDNQLTELDVSKNTGLTLLFCSNNQLTELDVSKNIGLIVLDCSNNQLTELNISKNPNISEVCCVQESMKKIYLTAAQKEALDIKYDCAGCSGKENEIHKTEGAEEIIVATYTITYNANGGINAPVAQVSPAGEVTLAGVGEMVYEGYTFLGWSTSADGEKEYDGGATYALSGNVELYAVWVANPVVETYTITYNANGGTNAPVAQTAPAGEVTLSGVGEMVYEGYTFLGWSTSADGEKEYEGGATYALSGNVELYAVWEEANAIEFTWKPTTDVTYEVSQLVKGIEITATEETTIDWGDNTELTKVEVGTKLYTHEYQEAGERVVKIKDDVVTKLDVSRVIDSGSLSSAGGNVANNQIYNLNLKNNTILEVLDCGSNQLTTIDVSANKKLIKLYCESNQLTTLDVSANEKLTDLYCGSNQLTTIDVSANEKLTDLYCESNQLTTLDVSKNTKLETLYCYNNQLTTIDISANIKLIRLDCSNTPLTTLNLSANTELQFLDCSNTPLTTLNLSTNTELQSLDCRDNQLSSLDISANTKLTDLICYNANITELDISRNPNISRVCCGQGSMKKLYLTAAQKEALDIKHDCTGCNQGELNEIHVKEGTEEIIVETYTITYNANGGTNAPVAQTAPAGEVTLAGVGEMVYEGYTFLGWSTSADGEKEYEGGATYALSGNVELYAVWEEAKAIEFRWKPTTDVTYEVSQLVKGIAITATEETTIDWGDNTELTKVEVGEHFYTHEYQNAGEYVVKIKDDVVTKLDVSRVIDSGLLSSAGGNMVNNQIYTLDLHNNTMLEYLECSVNELKKLNVNQNKKLETLYCYNNQITALDVSENKSLINLFCDYNPLGSLNVKENRELEVLACDNTQLSILDVSENKYLAALYCRHNQLTTLDVSKNTELSQLYCEGNQLTGLDISANTRLTSLDCSDNQLTELNISKNTELTSLYCYNNSLTELDISRNPNISKVCCAQESMKKFYLTATQKETFDIKYDCVGCYAGMEKGIHKTEGAEEIIVPEINTDNIEVAKLAEEAGCTPTLEDVEVKNGVVKVELKAEGLKEHKNAEGTLGYWIGFALKAPEGADKVYYEFNGKKETIELELNVTEEGDPGIAFYTDALNPVTIAKVQWMKGEDVLGSLVTYEIDLTEVNVVINTDNIVVAKLAEKAGCTPTLEDVEVKNGVVKVELKAEGLKEHKNAEGTLGYWIGFALKAPEGADKVYYEFNGKKETIELELNVTEEGDPGIAFYTDALNPVTIAKVQWMKGEDVLGSLVTYEMILTEVNVKVPAIVFKWGTSNDFDKYITIQSIGKIEIDWGDNSEVQEIEAKAEDFKLTHSYSREAGDRIYTVKIYNDAITKLDFTKQVSVAQKLNLVSRGLVATLGGELGTGTDQLISLDVSNAEALTYLDCSNSGLESLDVSDKPDLEYLDCSSNNLTELVVENNPKLTKLDCRDNGITSLDLSNNPELVELICTGNEFSELDISANAKLEKLEIDQSQKITLKLTQEQKDNLITDTTNITFNIVGDIRVTAIAGPNGRVTPTGAHMVQEGGSITITITPNKGYAVKDVLVDGVSVGAVKQYTFENVTTNHTLEARFKRFYVGREDESSSSTRPGGSNYGGSSSGIVLPQGIISSSWKNRFTDVSRDDWFYEVVKFVNERKYFAGVSEDSFGPNIPMTREMFIVALYNMDGKPITYGANKHFDVEPGRWSEAAVVWGGAKGLISGFPDGSFKPEEPITREQVATIMKKYAEYKYQYTSKREDLTRFNDREAISTWAYENISWAVANGIMKGDDLNNVLPQKSATRAEVAAMFMNYKKAY